MPAWGAIAAGAIGVLDAFVPFVDLAKGASQRRHERKLAKHARDLKIIDQGAEIRRGPLDEITFFIFFYPWIALWIPYEPVNTHAMEALGRIKEAPEIMLWPALLIVARIWGVSVDAIPKLLWKR
jgi:hypothetical protein